tara:strand:+ start:7737 stop:9206 length:1470 start_codon:yes stop_codon:yes gene_type:complete
LLKDKTVRLNLGHFQGIKNDAVEWKTFSFDRGKGPIELFVPQFTENQLLILCKQVKQASQTYLKNMPVSHVVDIIDTAISRLLDRSNPYRQQAEDILPKITGYDPQMIRLGLTNYLKIFRKAELNKFLLEDFSNPKILDEIQPLQKGGYGRAYGPDLLFHIWAGNVPGLPLWSLISGLLVKAGNIGKVSSSEPLMASLFAKMISEIDPKLGDCIAIVFWKGGSNNLEDFLLNQADLVLAYGNNDTLKQVRDHTPITTRCLTYGHKISFGMISRAALKTGKSWTTAHQAAYDIVRYDQQGCYSPQIFFVEQGGAVSPEQFAQFIARELENFERKFPRRKLNTQEINNFVSWRQAEELKAFSGEKRLIIAESESSWGVSYSDTVQELTPPGLNRTVQIFSVESLYEVTSIMQPYKNFLQTVGIAASPEELMKLSDALGKIGVTRISALGHMTTPEAGWHHDGRFNLLDLVSVLEVDRTAETAAEAFSTYVD